MCMGRGNCTKSGSFVTAGEFWVKDMGCIKSVMLCQCKLLQYSFLCKSWAKNLVFLGEVTQYW